MRNKHLFLFFFLLFLTTLVSNCGLFTKMPNTPTTNKTKTINKNVNYNAKTISTIVKTARTYIGTPYKYGGVDDNGLDCSGLVGLAFQSARLTMPRVSTDIAALGQEVKVKDIRVGDLVFFITDKGSRINHVGIVTERKNPENILFIHSASTGVREDNLFTKYYQSTFTKAMRPF